MTTTSDEHVCSQWEAVVYGYEDITIYLCIWCGEQLDKDEVMRNINATGAFDVHRAVRMHLWYEQLAADHYEPDPLFEEDLEALKRYILFLDPEAL